MSKNYLEIEDRRLYEATSAGKFINLVVFDEVMCKNPKFNLATPNINFYQNKRNKKKEKTSNMR